MDLFGEFIKSKTGVDLESMLPIPKTPTPIIALVPRSIKEKQKEKQREQQKKTENFLDNLIPGSGDVLHKLNQQNNQREDAKTKNKDNINNVLLSIPTAISEYFVDDKKPDIGDHLYVLRTGYTHHGIYIGKGEVIHYLMDCVTQSSLSEFAEGAKIRIYSKIQSPVHYSSHVIVSRAKSRLGEDSYNVFSNNCEHFVRWCRCNAFDSET